MNEITSEVPATKKTKWEKFLFWPVFFILIFCAFVYSVRVMIPPPKPIKLTTVVGFAADPAIKNDGDFALGYPNHRYTVSCVSNGPKTCTLEVENEKEGFVKTFPYVEQEWFTPGRKNRPYHSLDVVMSLPSYNGNGDLKFGMDVEKNNALYDVLKQNEWVK